MTIEHQSDAVTIEHQSDDVAIECTNPDGARTKPNNLLDLHYAHCCGGARAGDRIWRRRRLQLSIDLNQYCHFEQSSLLSQPCAINHTAHVQHILLRASHIPVVQNLKQFDLASIDVLS